MLKVLIGGVGLPAEHHMALGHEEGAVQQLIHGWRRLVEGKQHYAPRLRHLLQTTSRPQHLPCTQKEVTLRTMLCTIPAATAI